MALISPGVEVTVIDESQYIPSAVNTVPYFVVATAQNKVSSDGITVAAGTTAANANKTYLITSQRDLAATYGVPFFYNTTTGTPINGYELNEYGLLAAYSALGVTNRAYVQRVDVDLTELTATLNRPVGSAVDGTYWLDTANSLWGIFEWNQTTAAFTAITPIVITSTADVVNAAGGNYTPLTTVGAIGDYAVVPIDNFITGYYKDSSNAWVQIGSTAWQTSWATITGTNTPSSLTVGNNMYINNNLITVGATNTVAGFAAVINAAAIAGVTAAAVSGRLAIYANSNATNDGSTATNGVVSIQAGPNSGAALLTALGITADEYFAPVYFPGYSYQSPRWRTTDTTPRPTGSVWNNVSSANNGLNLSFKQYNAALDTFVAQAVPAFANDVFAFGTLDPAGGGKNIPVGTTYVQYDAQQYLTSPNSSFNFLILERITLGQAIYTGTTTPVGNAFTVGSSFSLSSTAQTNPGTLNTATVTIGGTGTVSDFIAAVSAANIPHIVASVNSAGNIVFTHVLGGDVITAPISGTPMTVAGFTLATSKARESSTLVNSIVFSNFVTTPLFTYTASTTEPDQDPADGRLWFYSTVSDVDIMIQNNGGWQGYQTVTNDVRGFDLSQTNASGPIIAASEPTTQNDASLSPLEYGDLWIDSSDLENYPVMYRWQPVSGVDQWTEANYPTIPSWIPNGTYPTVTSTWLTASGNKTNGAMYSGRQAQRKMIVAAMKSGIDTSTAAREEQNQFNIIATPAYPELTPNMIALSNERNNTLFVVADTPMRLGASGTELVTWATNDNGLGLPTEDGNSATSNYAGAFYPSCQTTDLGGNIVVAPPSHMMVRTILRSDAVSYPWLAPAGTRRGVIDNASAIGYIDSATGEFEQIGVSQSVRDILYERNINPITFIPGIGITNFGNKTTTTTTTALDRINVARLVAFLRGRLEEIGKLFLFEPNDEITRNEITNLCNSLMIDLIAKRAIYDYLVVCDLSNNTPARIDRNELWVDIAIEPVKAVEFIYIPLRIKNTGEIAAG